MQLDPWNWPALHSSGNGAGGMSFVAQQSPIARLFNGLVDTLIDRLAPCPWCDGSGAHVQPHKLTQATPKPLYTPAERARRDSTGWTLVQGILAPIQFAVFLLSLSLVLNYLLTGDGYGSAAVSVVIKTMLLYAIMITGAIWEKAVFGKYLFAEAFFWEDAVSMLVIALHTAYLAAMLTGWGTPHDRMVIALAAYASYAINASQFLLKLRAARLQAPAAPAPSGAR